VSHVSCDQHSISAAEVRDFLSGVKGLDVILQCAGIEPFGMPIEHRADEVERRGMQPQKFIGVGEVLQSLGDHAGSVIVVFRFSLCSTWGMKYSSCTSSFLSQRQVHLVLVKGSPG